MKAKLKQYNSWQYNFKPAREGTDQVLVHEDFLPKHLKGGIHRNAVMIEFQFLIYKWTLTLLASYYSRKL